MSELSIAPYTEKSFLVMGDTINHSKQLGKLGGKYIKTKNFGLQWMFGNCRKEIVEHYIKTGEIKEFVSNYVKKEIPNENYLTEIKKELTSAFSEPGNYSQEIIVDSINKIIEKYEKQL